MILKDKNIQIKQQQRQNGKETNSWPGKRPLSSLFYLEKKKINRKLHLKDRKSQCPRTTHPSDSKLRNTSRTTILKKIQSQKILSLKIVELKTEPIPCIQPQLQRKSANQILSKADKVGLMYEKTQRNQKKNMLKNHTFKNPFIANNLLKKNLYFNFRKPTMNKELLKLFITRPLSGKHKENRDPTQK